jgi:hypothetical protein
MDVAGEGRQVGDVLDVALAVQYRLVQVRDAPTLGDSEVEEGGELVRRFPGDVVPPGAEGGEQLPVLVQGDVPVHHPAEAAGRGPLQDDAVALLHVLRQGSVAGGDPSPDVVRL